MNKTKASIFVLIAALLFASIVLPVDKVITAEAASSTVLKWGSRGTQVADLQKTLMNLGYYDYTVTGYYGKITQDAVIRFQIAQGLKIDGIAGPQTIATLDKLSSQQSVSRGDGVLSYGIRSANVKALQDKLKALGYFNYTSTGYFGTLTKAAVLSWQKANNMKQDGVVRAEAIALMDKQIEASKSSGNGNGKFILGYSAVDYIGDNAAHNSVVNYGKHMSAVATFTYRVTAEGKLVAPTSVPRDTIKAAKNNGAKPLVLIHNYNNGFDPWVANKILSSWTNRQNLIKEVLKVIETEGYVGVNVDIEGIYVKDRDNYTQFLKELNSVLKPKGYIVSVAIPAKTRDDLNNGWSGGYNYKEIGKYVDYALIMTYDEHWIGGTPGPIASVPWVDSVLKYTTSQIPKNKVLLGLATYGYDWSAKGTQSLTYPKAVAKASATNATIKWHDTYQEPYYYYWDKDGKHEVWFNNQYTAKVRLQLVDKYDIAGIGIWRLGFEDANYWSTLQSYLQK